jgi:hypothetical protein
MVELGSKASLAHEVVIGFSTKSNGMWLSYMYFKGITFEEHIA